MADPRPRSSKPTQLLFDEDLELERQEEDEELKRRTAQIKRRQAAEARRKARMRKLRVIALVLMLVIVAALGSLRYFGVYPFGMPSHKPSPKELERLTRQWVVFAVEEIETFRGKNNRLPIDLSEVGIRATMGSWTYNRMGTERYLVSVKLDQASFSFDSANDPKRFIAEAPRR
jgi:hypothetical protein